MRQIWEKWKTIAQKIGNFQFKVIFSIFYFILITPVGVISSLFNDFLLTRQLPEWQRVEKNASSMEKLKSQ